MSCSPLLAGLLMQCGFEPLIAATPGNEASILLALSGVTILVWLYTRTFHHGSPIYPAVTFLCAVAALMLMVDALAPQDAQRFVGFVRESFIVWSALGGVACVGFFFFASLIQVLSVRGAWLCLLLYACGHVYMLLFGAAGTLLTRYLPAGTVIFFVWLFGNFGMGILVGLVLCGGFSVIPATGDSDPEAER
jgi:hypothetical protein